MELRLADGLPALTANTVITSALFVGNNWSTSSRSLIRNTGTLVGHLSEKMAEIDAYWTLFGDGEYGVIACFDCTSIPTKCMFVG